MEEEADIPQPGNDPAFVTRTSHGDARPRLTVLLDAFSVAVVGTIVTNTGAPERFPPT